MRRIFLILLIQALTVVAVADPLNASLEIGASVSHSYDARNLLVNPAAMAYQADLNGPGPTSSLLLGVNQGFDNELSHTLNYSYFGFGIESLSQPAGKFRRYSFGLGVPFHPMLYGGIRLQFQRADTPVIGDYDSLDLGLQFRPSPYFSLGFLANHARSTIRQYVFGATVRPLPFLDLSADLDTPSDNFFKKVSYQASANIEVIPGLHVSVGYHQDYQLQLGLQWNFLHGALVTHVQPQSDSKRVVTGLLFSPIPYRNSFQRAMGLRLDLDGSLSEEGFSGNLFSGERPSLAGVLKTLAEAEKNPPGIIVVHLESFPMGLASAEEIFEALSRLRERGTRIEVFLGNASLKEYLIASVGHVIHMEKSGTLTVLGLKSESYFVKGTLDKLGVQGEFLARGKFKSAPEMFTRTDSSDAHRQATKEEMAVAQTQVISLLGKYRGVDSKRWQEMIEHALWSADDLKQSKLIDAVDSFAHELERIEGHYALRESSRVRSERLALPPRIAVVPLSGDILASRMTVLSIAGRGTITPRRVDHLLSQALGDPRTSAIVLRVNSGGGEILASEEIAHLVEKAGKKKPIYLSMGDAAASGGYFIAIPAKRVFADPLTLTGSIGVFLGKFNLAGTFKWLQLKKEIISDAPYPNLFSEHQAWSPTERAILTKRMNQYYEGFTAYVAEKRKLTPAAAEKAAQGRVWLGHSALPLKLIDELGGINSAVRTAARDSDLSDYETWVVEDGGGLFDFSAGVLGKAGIFDEVLPSDLSRQMFWWAQLKKDPFLYLSPIDHF